MKWNFKLWEVYWNLRGYLLDALNLQEKQIYFEAKDEEGMTPNGDRLFVECRVSSEGKEVCGIHTEELYEDIWMVFDR